MITLVLALGLWKRLDRKLRYGLLSLLLMLAGTILGYAKYVDWSGNAAWGDRFTTVPVDLLAMLAVPMLWRYRSLLPRRDFRLLAWSGIGGATLMQFLSLPLNDNIERLQLAYSPTHRFFIPARRVVNLVALAGHRFTAWGLANNPYLQQHGVSVNLLPAYLNSLGEHRLAVFAWMLWLLILAFTLGFAMRLAFRAGKQAGRLEENPAALTAASDSRSDLSRFRENCLK